PSRASAIASRASVTVSIAAEAMGMFKMMSVVNLVAVRASPGSTYDSAGSSNTSSNVRPSLPNFQSQSRAPFRAPSRPDAMISPPPCDSQFSGGIPGVQPQPVQAGSEYSRRIQKAPSATCFVVHRACLYPASVPHLVGACRSLQNTVYLCDFITRDVSASTRVGGARESRGEHPPFPIPCRIVYDSRHAVRGSLPGPHSLAPSLAKVREDQRGAFWLPFPCRRGAGGEDIPRQSSSSSSKASMFMDSLASALVPDKTVAAFLDDLRALVNINSGTYTPEGVARVADYLQPLFEATGCVVERIPGE